MRTEHGWSESGHQDIWEARDPDQNTQKHLKTRFLRAFMPRTDVQINFKFIFMPKQCIVLDQKVNEKLSDFSFYLPRQSSDLFLSVENKIAGHSRHTNHTHTHTHVQQKNILSLTIAQSLPGVPIIIFGLICVNNRSCFTNAIPPTKLTQ